MEPSLRRQLEARLDPPRPPELVHALKVIESFGGMVGSTTAARILGKKDPTNLPYHVPPVDRIDCGSVYLRWDCEQKRARSRSEA